MEMPTDAKLETIPKAFLYQLLSLISEPWHIVKKPAKATLQHYKHRHDVQVREKTLFSASQFVSVHCPPLLTSASYKISVGAYPKLFQRAL